MVINSQHVISQWLSEMSRLVLLRGILAILLGFLLLTKTTATLIVIMMFLGAYWFVDGIFTLITSFKGKKENKYWSWGFFVSILSILAGLVVFFHPISSTLFTTSFLVYLMGTMMFLSGISSIFTGFRLRKTSGQWVMIIGGILAVILSLILLFTPSSTYIFISMLGIFSILGGIVLIVLSFRIRDVKSKMS